MLEKLEPGRTKGAVERKRMNISAALLDAGLPCIDGYKPYRNYQSLLRDVVDTVIVSDPRVRAALDAKTVSPVELPSVENILAAMEAAPESRYQLYRVFRFTGTPWLFALPGSVASTCELTPSELRAVVK